MGCAYYQTITPAQVMLLDLLILWLVSDPRLSQAGQKLNDDSGVPGFRSVPQAWTDRGSQQRASAQACWGACAQQSSLCNRGEESDLLDKGVS